MTAEPPHSDLSVVLVGRDEIAQRVAEMAATLDAHFADIDQPLVVLPLLTGALIFAADLVRQMKTPLTIEPLSANSYRGDATRAGKLEIRLGPDDLTGRDVLLVDDIFDSGQTMEKMIEACKAAGANQVTTVVLLHKCRPDLPQRAEYCDFWAIEIPDAFVVGYGLDHDGRYRDLPDIGILAEHAR